MWLCGYPPVEFRNFGIMGRDVGVYLGPLELRNYGNFGKKFGGVATPTWEFGIPGIIGRDVISLGLQEFQNSENYLKRFHITAPFGIPEIRGRVVISLGALEFRNSLNFGKR